VASSAIAGTAVQTTATMVMSASDLRYTFMAFLHIFVGAYKFTRAGPPNEPLSAEEISNFGFRISNLSPTRPVAARNS